MKVKASIIMTVYNRERYLHSAIESFLMQSWKDAELIIVDDGSTDNSPEIALHYMNIDPRVRVVLAAHEGRVSALCHACSLAKGSYLGWLDSDDSLVATALEETIEVLDNRSDVGLVYTDYSEIDEDNRILGIGRRCQDSYTKEKLMKNFMVFHFRLMRKSVFDAAGGIDLDFTYAHDYDLCLRLSEITEFFHIPKILYNYRIHKESISWQWRAQQLHFFQLATAKAILRREEA
ncbi:glycosyltransferase [Phormidium tenue]|uniref:Glycosyltransferase 2-like domain-containing protein n=1 Tax=Phormidium tenue NIES-30 TaxID=549789 RepID=A0A1U7J7S6_9CYAN|nr:glycosyltransferase [Phormidium tenue]MBD2231494.1 glycosyltransferase [Phormidium tenue FACHB-1052]OKH49116.1 hypothetical protein NIES30_08095 [Phormidium tenue NIES-30]